MGSDNLTMNADLHQWNDLYFLSGKELLFKQFVNLFKDMKHDYNTRQPARFFCGEPPGSACDDSVDKYTTWAFPKLSGPRNDLVLDMLGQDPVPHARRAAAATPAPTWPWPCTRCAASAATTSPRRSGRSTPRAATSASTTG